MGNRVLTVRTENCTGCRMCELACSSSKEKEFNPDISRIRIVSSGLEGWSRPSVCLQCEEPVCMNSCQYEAIYKTKTDNGDYIVAMDVGKCTGCRHCVVACPFGAIDFISGQGAMKCDLCSGSPICVDFCFYGCLEFVELTDKLYEKRAKKIKSLTARACSEISRREPHRRRADFSLDASKVSNT